MVIKIYIFLQMEIWVITIGCLWLESSYMEYVMIFFFVTGYMYTENKANEKIKNAAQGLFTVATYGIGMAIGSAMAGYISDYYTINEIKNWPDIWMVSSIYCCGCFIIFNHIF